MLESIDPIWIFYVSIFGVAIILFDVIQSLFMGPAGYRTQVNKRLERQAGETSREQTIVDLRRDRGLTVDGNWRLPVIWLNRLILQSGVSVGTTKLAMGAGGLSVASGAAGFMAVGLIGIVAGLFAGGVVLPLGALWYLRRRRKKKFTDQLAEALDIIVRSLRAGHPVPSALKLAAREMPDPIGTEFGTVEDEVTFGLDLETALRNMYERVGQEDLPLFVASIAIQSSSGGNLTEILENLATVIRLRVKMRRKIQAISAEGRISALILSATPFALFGIINAMNPQFYGSHWSHPWMMYGLGGAFFWMAIGNLWMRKMINFRI